MRPDDPLSRGPVVPQRNVVRSAGARHDASTHSVNDAAANIVRNQIDSLYTTQAQAQDTLADDTHSKGPYDQTHGTATDTGASQWKQYHSAWQDYYRQYYERYYVSQVNQAKQELAAKAMSATPPEAPVSVQAVADRTFSRDEAMDDLRSKLLGQVKQSAKKVRHSKHFIPIIAGVSVIVLFLFLQYNRILIANVEAYVSPGNIDPQNIIVDPTATTAVSNDPRLIIPKINVDVPVVYDVTTDHDAQMKAMENGVAYFGIRGANSKPGQLGNTPIAGHSSNDFIDVGDYKFIFAQLDRLGEGDTIYANYQGTRYTYKVFKKEVVLPSQASKLVLPADKPYLTLITCTPLGTAQKRLLVFAEQISPDPSSASAAPSGSGSGSGSTVIPGNSPTIVERLLGSQ